MRSRRRWVAKAVEARCLWARRVFCNALSRNHTCDFKQTVKAPYGHIKTPRYSFGELLYICLVKVTVVNL